MSNQKQQAHASNASDLKLSQSGAPSVAGMQGAQPAAPIGGLAQQLAALAGGAFMLPEIPGIGSIPLMTTASGVGLSASSAHQPVPDPKTGYRDYSRVFLDDAASSSYSNSKDHAFPVKLHKILSDPSYTDCITWLPHGRSFRVLKPKDFEEKVIPTHFRQTKYASFMRQVNGWGFKRVTQGPDHNSYYHELFLRGLPKLCQKMKRPAKTPDSNVGLGGHPDFYAISLYAPLPNSFPRVLAPTFTSVSTCPTNNYSGASGASDRGAVSNSVTAHPATSDSDPNGTSSDWDRNLRSRDDSGGSGKVERDSGEEDRNSGGGSSDSGRADEPNRSDPGSDRISVYNFSASDACGSDTERNSGSASGSEGFEPSSSPSTTGKKGPSKKRRHPRQVLLWRADSSISKWSGDSDSSERSSVRDFKHLLSNGQADFSSAVGSASQDSAPSQLPTMVEPTAAATGLPSAAAASLAESGQQQAAAQPTGAPNTTAAAPLTASAQPNATLPLTAPLTAANLSSINQLSGDGTNVLTTPLAAANLSAVNQLSAGPLAAPLTATNLSYLSLQNQLIQSQAMISQLLAYQKRMGFPSMPMPGAPQPSPTSNPGGHGKADG